MVIVFYFTHLIEWVDLVSMLKIYQKDIAHRQTFCVKTKSEDPTEFSGIQRISSDHVLLPFTRGLGSFSTLIAMEPLPMDLHST